jgi:hypothetical protein
MTIGVGLAALGDAASYDQIFKGVSKVEALGKIN